MLPCEGNPEEYFGPEDYTRRDESVKFFTQARRTRLTALCNTCPLSRAVGDGSCYEASQSPHVKFGFWDGEVKSDEWVDS